MIEIVLKNNEFLRQFETKVDDSLARIEYAEQERKIFLTKVVVPDTIKDKSFEERFIKSVLEVLSEKKIKVVPTSPKIAGFVRRNKSYKSLLPVGIKL
ncbi:MAG: N-acetyltransferase [Flavobacteriaceae bacterium]|nr:N-acetyltransferase [Flavobacteriaceae bacterium]|tara:strand:- start:1719 stop:2012 length:294 start_codon:yes stop_codon:yes gene_type:complete